MKKWVIKAIVQKLFGIMPGGFKLNYVFQRYVSRAVVLRDEFFETMLSHFRELQEYTTKWNFRMEKSRIFEIGTGWHPIVPVCFWLSGAGEVVTVDLNSHLRKKNLKVLVEKFVKFYESGKLEKYFSVDPGRMQELRNCLGVLDQMGTDEILSHLNIRQLIIDASSTTYPSEYFDMCYSINVYEHINEGDLPGITSELNRISKQAAYGYHAIGVYDHFSHIDRSISKFNYLRFSRRQWRIIDNRIQPQNRLRISHFRELFEKNGFEVQDEIFQSSEPWEVEKVPIHPDFNGVSDLDVPYGTFILRKRSV